MSFISNIFQVIDTIGSKSFEQGKKQEKINLDLKSFTNIFLGVLDRFEGTNNFSLTYYKTGLLGLRGLKLIKTDYNSTDNRVNPEFLDALKKSAVTYMNIIAAAQWQVYTEEKIKSPNSIFKLARDSECLFYRNKFENMENAQNILDFIIRDRNLSMLIYGTVSGIIIGGKQKDLTLFFIILEEESMKFKNWETTKSAQSRLP